MCVLGWGLVHATYLRLSAYDFEYTVFILFTHFCFYWKLLCIQGISRLVDITAGGDFLCLCDQKSSYKHVSDFWTVTELWAFFNSRTRPRVNRVLRNQPVGAVLGLVAYRLRKLQRATRPVRDQAAACVAAGGSFFENEL